jgi:hypothetical protein
VFQIGGADLVLEPGQSVVVPMWVHVQQQPGRFVFQCAWFCEPQVSYARITPCSVTLPTGLCLWVLLFVVLLACELASLRALP